MLNCSKKDLKAVFKAFGTQLSAYPTQKDVNILVSSENDKPCFSFGLGKTGDLPALYAKVKVPSKSLFSAKESFQVRASDLHNFLTKTPASAKQISLQPHGDTGPVTLSTGKITYDSLPFGQEEGEEENPSFLYSNDGLDEGAPYSFTLKADALLDILQRGLPAAYPSGCARWELEGIIIYRDPESTPDENHRGKLCFDATDSHRGTHAVIEGPMSAGLTAASDNGYFVIGKVATKALIGMLSSIPHGDMDDATLTWSEDKLWFQVTTPHISLTGSAVFEGAGGTTMMVSVLKEGRPDSRTAYATVTAPHKEMAEAVPLIAGLSRKRKDKTVNNGDPVVVIDYSEGALRLTGLHGNPSVAMESSVAFSAEENVTVKAGYQVRYLRQMLESLHGDTVTMTFQEHTGSAPVYFREETPWGLYEAMLMPIRI